MSNFYQDSQWNWFEDLNQSSKKNQSIVEEEATKIKQQLYFQDEQHQNEIQHPKTEKEKNALDEDSQPKSKKTQENKQIKYEYINLKRQTSAQNSKEMMEQKPKKQLNQCVYSKNYRQKKKQRLKILQEENVFLKKKVDQLQERLRQKQHQLNRLKYDKIDPQMSIQQLNKELLDKVKLVLSEVQQKSKVNQNEFQSFSKNLKPQKQIYKKFFQTYDCHGFGGRKKIEILQYYINELLQNVLRDSEKYYYICMIKKKGWAHMNNESSQSEFNIIDFAVRDIMKYGNLQNVMQENKMLLYQNALKPIFVNLKNSCCQLYQSYQKMVLALGKTQQFVKTAYSSNFEFAIKRMRIQNWFQQYQHRKQIRNLKVEWMKMIKREEDVQIHSAKIKSKIKTSHQ